MAVVKVRNKLDHKLMIKGMLVDPNGVVEVDDSDEHVQHALKQGIIEPADGAAPAEEAPAEAVSEETPAEAAAEASEQTTPAEAPEQTAPAEEAPKQEKPKKSRKRKKA